MHGPVRFLGMICARKGRKFASDTRGAAIVEFAIVAPVFMAIIVAIIETAFVFLAQDGLETAAETTGRLLLTGQAQQGGLTQAQFKQKACDALPGYLKCTDLMVDVRTATTFSTASTGVPTITYDSSGNVTNVFTYDPGDRSAIVVVRLLYLWPTITGNLGFDISNQPGNRRLLIATTVFRSENY